MSREKSSFRRTVKNWVQSRPCSSARAAGKPQSRSAPWGTAGLQILCPLHQLCGLVPQVAPVRTQSGISAAILALLHPVGPEGGPAGRLLQAADLSPQGLISRGLPPVPALFFLVPDGKVPLDQLRASAVWDYITGVHLLSTHDLTPLKHSGSRHALGWALW